MKLRTLPSVAGSRTASIAGIDATPLLERLAKDREALAAVLKHLSHPHADHYGDKTLALLQHQAVLAANHYVDTHPGERQPHAADVLLWAAYSARMPEETRLKILGGVAAEAELTDPVAKHLEKTEGPRVEREVTIGPRRADLVSFSKSWGVRRMVAVELKNNHVSFSWLEDQLDAYSRATDEIRVVMTPHCMVGLAHHGGWLCEPDRVARKVEKMGASLFVYDAASGLFTKVHEGASEYQDAKYEELWGRYHPAAASAA